MTSHSLEAVGRLSDEVEDLLVGGALDADAVDGHDDVT